MKKIIFITVFLFSITFSQTLYDDIGHIPQSQQLEWHRAGLLPGWPKKAQFLIDISRESGSSNEKVNSALQKARVYSAIGATTILYFPNGTYSFNQTIELTVADSNIVFQGKSPNVNLDFSSLSINSPCFYIHGNASSTPVDLSDDWDMHTNTISSNNFLDVNAGDWIYIYEDQFPHFENNMIRDWVGQMTKII